MAYFDDAVSASEKIDADVYAKWLHILNPEGHKYIYTEDGNRVDVIYIDISRIDELKGRDIPWYGYLTVGTWYEKTKQDGMQAREADKRYYVVFFQDEVVMVWDVSEKIDDSRFEAVPATRTTVGGTWGDDTVMKERTTLDYMDAEMYMDGRHLSRDEKSALFKEYWNKSLEWQKMNRERKAEKKRQKKQNMIDLARSISRMITEENEALHAS